MPDRRQLNFGSVPVPYSVSWSAEEKPMFLAVCPYAGRVAISQRSARGDGKPMFGAPHMNRQREVIALALCDLCGRPLKNRTKVSLSQARPQLHAARSGDILQVEPLLHRECAAICMRHCPSLRRQQRDGVLNIRQVFRHACQFALYSEQGTFEATGQRRKSISHAKVQLIKFEDRDEAWLEAHDA
jgi:hypothetical protein